MVNRSLGAFTHPELRVRAGRIIGQHGFCTKLADSRMLMVILGAGASFDPVDMSLDSYMATNATYRPPLAKDLFEARPNFSIAFDEFPEISPLVNRLRRSVGRGDLLEATLKEIEGEAQGYPYRHRQLLALRYYPRRIVSECGTTWMREAHGVTHYAELVDEIERWRVQTRTDVCYVTFNYDTMIEDVLGPRYGAGFVDVPSYLRSDFTLIKLHGSVDWAHRVPVPPDIVGNVGELRNYLFEYAGRYQLFGIVKAGSGQVVYEKDGLVPALAIPVQGKTTFECPKEHLARLNEAFRQTTHVVTIGWRGVEQHFLDLWKNRNDFFDLIVVSGSGSWSAETLENLRAGQMVKDDNRYRRVAFEGGFGELLGSGELRSFLGSPSSAHV